MKEFSKLERILIFLIVVISVIILLIIFFSNVNIDRSLQLSIFESSKIIFGVLTLFVGSLTIYILFKRDKHIQKQISQTEKQIQIQDNTRKDQQFLDAIKLIEENPENLGARLGGLSLLESLAKNSIKHRFQILSYLNIYTSKLKGEVEQIINFKLSSENNMEFGIFLKHEDLYNNKTGIINLENIFPKECLKVVNTIINLNNSGRLDLSNFYFPFLVIKQPTNSKLINTSKNNNLIGLKYKNRLDNKNDSSLVFNQFSVFEGYDSNKFLNFQNKLEQVRISKFSELGLVNSKSCWFSEGKITIFNKLTMNPGKYEIKSSIIEKCVFENINFSIYNSNSKTLEFRNCIFYKNVIFEKMEIEEIYFTFENEFLQECRTSEQKSELFKFPTLRLKIEGVENIRILSNNKEKLIMMIENLKLIIGFNKKINLPEFKNEYLVEKELKDLIEFKKSFQNQK